MTNTIGFLGGGRITAIFLSAWEAKGIELGKVIVSDSDPAVLERLQAAHPGIETTLDNQDPVRQDVVFLALHPPVMKTLLPTVAQSLSPNSTVVSLAPVLDFASLRTGLNGHGRLVRMIPNAPALVGLGYNPMVFGPGATPEDHERVSGLFRALGECPLVPEGQLEAHAILTAMGPTYFWPQWQVLRELGQSFGLDGKTVDRGLAAMLHGAVTQMLERGYSFDEVMDTIPAKPLAEAQEALQAPFKEKLPALHAKLTSAANRSN